LIKLKSDNDATSVGFVGVNLQQRCGGGKESGLKCAGDKQNQ